MGAAVLVVQSIGWFGTATTSGGLRMNIVQPLAYRPTTNVAVRIMRSLYFDGTLPRSHLAARGFFRAAHFRARLGELAFEVRDLVAQRLLGVAPPRARQVPLGGCEAVLERLAAAQEAVDARLRGRE